MLCREDQLFWAQVRHSVGWISLDGVAQWQLFLTLEKRIHASKFLSLEKDPVFFGVGLCGGLGQKAQGTGYELVPRGGPRLYLRSQKEAFCSVKVLFFAGQPWPDMSYRLSSWKLASQSHKQDGWVGCVLADRLWLIEGKILGIFWEKCQVVVLTLTPKIETYFHTL